MQRTHEQPTAEQQQERERDLSDDERLAETPARQHARRRQLERGCQVQTGREQRGQQAAEQGDDGGGGEADEEDGAIKFGRDVRRAIRRDREQGREQSGRERRQSDAGRTA